MPKGLNQRDAYLQLSTSMRPIAFDAGNGIESKHVKTILCREHRDQRLLLVLTMQGPRVGNLMRWNIRMDCARGSVRMSLQKFWLREMRFHPLLAVRTGKRSGKTTISTHLDEPSGAGLHHEALSWTRVPKHSAGEMWWKKDVNKMKIMKHHEMPGAPGFETLGDTDNAAWCQDYNTILWRTAWPKHKRATIHSLSNQCKKSAPFWADLATQPRWECVQYQKHGISRCRVIAVMHGNVTQSCTNRKTKFGSWNVYDNVAQSSSSSLTCLSLNPSRFKGATNDRHPAKQRIQRLSQATSFA